MEVNGPRSSPDSRKSRGASQRRVNGAGRREAAGAERRGRPGESGPASVFAGETAEIPSPGTLIPAGRGCP